MKSVTILVVEDESIVALDLQRRLRRMGYRASYIVSTGMDAIRLAGENAFDLVLMDIKLSGEMDGIEAADYIRFKLDIPVIYLTAFADQETLERAKHTEPYAYLLKPFKERELRTTIEMALYRHKMERRVRDTMQELRVRNEELDAFAHTVAHDIRNPLSLILGYAEGLVALHGPHLQPDILEDLEVIARNARKLENITQELMLLAGVRKVEAELTPLMMGSIVQEAIGRLKDLIDKTGSQIILPDEWPFALGYAPWVEEVWMNYISNAVKYGGNPPVIELGATVQDDGMICFWVRDNGLGITSEEQSRLFTPFTQLRQARVTGSGLGLSIVHRIVEKLGGEVALESHPGQGSVFSFTLPGLD